LCYVAVAGLHPGTGGNGLSACSGDMLLEALVACAGVTLNAVATSLGIELRDAVLEAEGDLDFRGTLGLVKDVPADFQHIRLQITIDTDASDEQVDTLLQIYRCSMRFNARMLEFLTTSARCCYHVQHEGGRASSYSRHLFRRGFRRVGSVATTAAACRVGASLQVPACVCG
jgi:uncharacterized OsmC-like protein